MSSIRRALFLASAERYIIILINLAMIPIVARLMAPAEFGISVLGMAALAIVEAIRDFGGTAYIIQERELTTERVRTSFTITLVWTIVLAGALVLAAGPLASFYGVPGLKFYLEIVALSYLLGPFVGPLFALLRREMAFGRLAVITVTTSVIYAIATISFASFGFSYMSFAWASLISANCGMLLGFYFRPDFSIFRLSLKHWRNLVNFGGYQTFAHLLADLWEYIPYLIIGRFLDVSAIGIYQRATSLCQLPKKALLGGIAYVAMPAFAANVRENGDLKASYLRAVSFTTGLYWPALAVLAILAYPIVSMLLGWQWLAVASLVPIMAVALMFNFSVNLTMGLLVAGGAFRSVFYLYLIVVPVSTLIVLVAARFGLSGLAWSMFLLVPLEAAVSLYFIRRMIPFSLRDLFDTLYPSVLLTMFCIAGPLAAIALNGGHFDVTRAAALVAMAASGVGWLVGLRLLKHPLNDELQLVIRSLRGRWQRRMAPLATTP